MRLLSGCLILLIVLAAVVGWLWWEIWHLQEDDWLLAAVGAPDRQSVARLWCPDECDVAGRFILTISPASRVISLEQPVSGFPPDGPMPDEDAILEGYVALRGADDIPAQGLAIRLRWHGNDTLFVEGRCLSDGNERRIAGVLRRGYRVIISEQNQLENCHIYD